ncbi:hypothetical protein DICPUDRAFT_80101 [Dictyostelium purpureum]|uniref:Uncharacterized protein n=1 Tax=Dictyostelium purpureum TaxID=5786 RepID=F0ZPJ3_DICPU|nr:uncharacterized protein DICPUDRAFT_80101 [Dictyostelium purpureum]EGC34132.1 hypothetical protein DICPUDRAFT_80101 [Dictyostelium purpureum]|eukprot:XP_003289330.1 hypothetical protein DICPUDRAFT_80101 [Dictyostelium purpureum]
MSETSTSTATAAKNNKKSLYEIIFKSKEFVLDVYIRFDCFFYFILSFLGIYSPDGFKSVIDFQKFFKNPNFTEPAQRLLDESEDYSEELLSNQEQQPSFDSEGFAKFYENQIFLNLLTMYSVLLATVTFIQSIIALRILLSKEKSVKTSNIHLLLIIDFVLIIFNAWIVFFKSHLFLPIGFMATILSLLISIIDFSILFFLSSSHKTLVSSVKSFISSISSFSKTAKKAYKDELKKKKQEQLEKQKQKKTK